MKRPDAWLRGPVEGVPEPLMPAAHAFVQVMEDVRAAAAGLPVELLWTRPGGAASCGFHLKHLVGSTGRLMGYARGEQLSDRQKAEMAAEGEPGGPDETPEVLAERVTHALEQAIEALRRTDPSTLGEAREVGAARLPTTVGGAIFHAAEHAQRHAGQLVTTVKILRGTGLSEAPVP